MKRPLLSVLLAASAFTVTTASAQETFFGALDNDVVFNNGVLLQGVTATSDSNAEITLEGAGTLTVANTSGGGFPRLMVVGGTKITSERSFASDDLNKTTWSGQFDAPTSTVKPGFFDINDPGAGFAGDYEAVEAYGMGLSNETFKFSTEADIVFPVSSQNGQKLYVATEKTDNTWDVSKTDFCIVADGLCALQLASINKVALIMEKFETCPVQNIANGTVGGTPNCIFSCSGGFKLNDTATGCVESGGTESFESQFTETTQETTTTTEQQLFENQIVAPAKEYDFPPGHFRYRASAERFDRYLPADGVSGDVWLNQNDGATDMLKKERNVIDMTSNAGRLRAVNTSFYSRNPRTAEEQLAAQNTNKSADEKANDEADFMSYLITMRNYFGKNSQENHYTAMSAEGGSAAEEATATDGESASEATGEVKEEAASGGAFLSSGALLPSTGPGIFITIAVVGFALMMFGARRS